MSGFPLHMGEAQPFDFLFRLMLGVMIWFSLTGAIGALNGLARIGFLL